MVVRANRRTFLTVAAMGLGSYAAPTAAEEKKSGRPAGKLPARGELVIRNAYVMTMDATLGDIPRGDVHVRNGEIVAVGRRR